MQVFSKLLVVCCILALAAGPASPRGFLYRQSPGIPPGGWQLPCVSANGLGVNVPTFGGYYFTTSDGGANWVQRTTSGSRQWVFGGCSSNGQIIYGAEQGGNAWKSTDGGATWTQLNITGSIQQWEQIVCSSDGSVVAAQVGSTTQGHIYVSTNGGSTWATTSAPIVTWFNLSISGDGTKIAAVNNVNGGGGIDDGKVYVSTNQGSTWTGSLPNGHNDGRWVQYSRDGSTIWAANATTIQRSTNDGVTWSDVTPALGINDWNTVGTSANGAIAFVGTYNGASSFGSVYTTNSGSTWTQIRFIDQLTFAPSDNGQVVAAVKFNGPLYISKDGGVTWVIQ